jgi:hypothetical protein
VEQTAQLQYFQLFHHLAVAVAQEHLWVSMGHQAVRAVELVKMLLVALEQQVKDLEVETVVVQVRFPVLAEAAQASKALMAEARL